MLRSIPPIGLVFLLQHCALKVRKEGKRDTQIHKLFALGLRVATLGILRVLVNTFVRLDKRNRKKECIKNRACVC